MIQQLAESRRRFDFWRRWHPYVLTSKQLAGDEAIWNSVLIDVASSVVAARELSSAKAADLIDELSLPRDLTDDIVARTVDERADHLGFRIYTPMDVYMEMLPSWISLEGWELEGTKRFAPSGRFQERVGASAEMAQVWIRTADTQVELELFDIHKPFGAGVDELGTAAADLLGRATPPPAARSWQPFRSDEIWHYGVLLGTAEDVGLVHHRLTGIVGDRSDLTLRNADVVLNLWHGSHHTKISDGNLEIEFLSYVDDWRFDD